MIFFLTVASDNAMGLKISLKPKERLVINSAVVSNAGNSECTLTVENNATILRENNIMREQDANTPCKQLYFIIQLMYLDAENISYHQQAFRKLVGDILDAAPSTSPYIEKINHDLSNQKYYNSLKSVKKLVDYEKSLFALKDTPVTR